MAEVPTLKHLARINTPEEEQSQQQLPYPIKKNTINSPQILSQHSYKQITQKELSDPQPTGLRACWAQLTPKKKIAYVVTAVLVLAAIILIPLLIHLYVTSPSKVEYHTQLLQNYRMGKTGEWFTILPATLTKRKLSGPNEVYEGEYVIFKEGSQNGAGKEQVMAVMTDKQSGITVKKFKGNNNIIVEIDPKQLMKFSYKNDPTENKRLLAQIALTEPHDHIESLSDVESPEFAKELLDLLAQSLNMTNVDTQLVLQEQYKAVRTPHGFELKQNQSSLFEKATKRNLRKWSQKITNVVTRPVTNLVQNTVALLQKPPKQEIITTTTTTIENTNITNINNTNVTTTNINTGQGNVAVGANNTLSNPQHTQTDTKITNEQKQEMLITRKKETQTSQKDELDFETLLNPKTIRAGAGCTKTEGGQRCPVDEWLDKDSPYEVVGEKSRKNKESDYVYVFSSKELMQLLGMLKRKQKDS